MEEKKYAFILEVLSGFQKFYQFKSVIYMVEWQDEIGLINN